MLRDPPDGGLTKVGAGTLTLSAANTYTGSTTVSNGTLMVNGSLAGGGGTGGRLTKIGTGTLTLSGANSYMGPTTISDGTLLVSGSIGTGAVGVQNGATLGGGGAIGGVVTVQSGGTLQPGLGGGDTSTLTINNSLTLAGKAVFTLNRTNAQTASKVFGVSLLTLGGTLSVTNAGPPLQAGDTFKLFNGTLSGAFAVTNLSALASTNLYWDVSLLNCQGIIRVASTVAPRPTIQPPSWSGTNLVLKLQSEAGFNYVLEAAPALVPASWTGIQTNAGGGLLSFTVPINPASRQQFLRLRVQ